jgi:hypothetical protein
VGQLVPVPVNAAKVAGASAKASVVNEPVLLPWMKLSTPDSVNVVKPGRLNVLSWQWRIHDPAYRLSTTTLYESITGHRFAKEGALWL